VSPDERNDSVKLGSLLSIADQIQAFGLTRKTGEIRVTNVGLTARISIVDGEVCDAEFGEKSGLEAAIALVNLTELQTEFRANVKPQRRTIRMPYMEILLNAAQQLDASGAGAPPAKGTSQTAYPSLRVMLDSGIRSFTVKLGVSYIGRAMTNDIVIPNQTVSDQHASIERTPAGIILKDLGSTNGTYVNKEKIRQHRLNGEVNLQFGLVEAVFFESARIVS
jgi:hypothetical protein